MACFNAIFEVIFIYTTYKITFNEYPSRFFLTILTKSYGKNELDTSTLLKDFFNDSFKNLIRVLNITNFQARASKTGDMFEYAFRYLMKNKYKIELKGSVSIPKACMVDGGELDFALYK